MSIPSQQVSCVRLFDRFTGFIFGKGGHDLSRVRETQEKSQRDAVG